MDEITLPDNQDTNDIPLPSNEEIQALYYKKTQEILFEFNDDMIALENKIRSAKENTV